ncbi:MAG: hypothetical protein M1833_003187 [Piccolia ochrophora]|nr:MAG: hypothetical protein M1833_003187 [Piccolia ochrophora]
MDREQARQESHQRYLEHRFEAPRIIRGRGIPCVVWAEDALKHYGVPILPFELFVLVDDVDAATQCLKAARYTTAEPRQSESLPELMEGSSRLLQPPASGGDLESAVPFHQTVVVLLPASRWKCSLPSAPASSHISASDPFPFPSLPALLDSVIDAWLDAPATYFATHVNCHLAYLYDYVDQVRTPGFVDELYPAHREFHLRYVSEPIRGSKRLEWRRRRDAFLADGGEHLANANAVSRREENTRGPP